MKNIIFTISVFVLLCSSVFAQDNSSKKSYFRYAISTPTKNYWEYGDYSDENSSKKGGVVEFGTMFYFNKLNLGSKSKLGIDVTYLSASKHTFSQSSGFLKGKILFYNLGTKIGPVYSFNIVDKLNVDVFAKVNPVWANVGVADPLTADPIEYSKGFMAVKYSFGMNLRYDFIMLGAEMNIGKLKYQSVDDKDVYVGNSPLPETEETNSPCFNVSLGFCF